MNDSNLCLYEILVPTVHPNGKPFRTRYHRVWDTNIRAISGGLTILPVTKGQWMHLDKLYSERMIPVRVIASPDQISQIIDYTLTYYSQQAVLAYKLSSEVILRYA